jgi:hypothetical protein
MYYFEYPSLVAMLVREVRYGVEVTLDAVEVNPFGAPAVFDFHTGDVNVHMDAAAQSVLSVPGAGMFPYVLHAMQAGVEYTVAVAEGCATAFAPLQVTASAEGVLSFSAPRGTDCAVTVTRA